MTRERHKVADLKVKPVERAAPTVTSLAPPLREVEERTKSSIIGDPNPHQNTEASATWRADMIRASAQRKRNIRLRKLAHQKESGSLKV